jgi:CTP:molybdopterin cytidylyltransferase MocA
VVRALTDAAKTNPQEIVRLAFAEGRGPTLLRRAIWDEARALTGDTGARVIAERRPELVFEARVAGPAPVDVDTPEDLERLDG